jgi:two-component system chemotaxis sensor kinase CheA
MSKIEQHKDIFIEEAYELLAELETSLLEMEEDPCNEELIGRVFRALHTIKGSGAMFGFDDIAAFTHEVETVFDMVRNGAMEATKELIDLTLAARDHIKNMLDDSESTDQDRGVGIITSLKNLIPGEESQEQPDSNEPEDSADEDSPETPGNEGSTIYRIRFRPVPDIFMKGTNPVLLLKELQGLGECKVIAQKEAIPALDDINPELCYTYWDIILTSIKDINTIKDVFIFVEDDCELSIDVIHDSTNPDADHSCKKLGEILVERGDITEDVVHSVLAGQSKKPIGERLVDAGLVKRSVVESALAEQQQIKELRETREKQQKKEAASSIRVSSDKLDTLVNLVGELVTVQARLSQTTATRNDPDLLMIAEEVERLTEELRDNTMSVRMVPIGTMFSKFKRLVRDLSGEMYKEVQMSTDGAETELDKTVIDKLNDPMVHLIRNSIDHGIESPDSREAIGKQREGSLHLSARHSGTNVLIEITDDGAGLDPEVIRAKAIEKGLIDPGTELKEKEIFAQILTPGFSTAKKISNVSGRGVGMDVVKRNIEALRGSIEIQSKKHAGTTITLSLPLTLAIIDGLLVKIGEELFVLPLAMVEECVELTGDDVENAHGRQIANVRGEIIPYISLREKFLIHSDKPDIEQIVITTVDDQRVGFVVDHVIGEHQTVIKSLGKVYMNVEGVSGATILGDGTVALILDAPKIVQSAVNMEALVGQA